MNKITISIHYAGLQLRIGKSAQGQDVTPLKPLSDLFGLKWQEQRKKVTESAFLRSHLGISGTDNSISNSDSSVSSDISGRDNPISNGHSGRKNPTYQDELFIRLDRVAAYLMTINPDRVRANGNLGGAEFLEEKLKEWADAVHDYELLGFAVNQQHLKTQEALRKQRVAFAAMIGVKNKTASLTDRAAIAHLLKGMADGIGIPYQPDLIDTAGD